MADEQENLASIQHLLQLGCGYQLIATFHRLLGEFDSGFFRLHFLLESICATTGQESRDEQKHMPAGILSTHS